jgi:hypothetical protein
LRKETRAVGLNNALKTVLATMINIVDCLYYMFNYKVSRFLLEKFEIKDAQTKDFAAAARDGKLKKLKGCS